MLLLGAGESGKSTIFKQMKIINNNGFSESERGTYKHIVHANTIASMNSLLDAVTTLGLEMPDDLQATQTSN